MKVRRLSTLMSVGALALVTACSTAPRRDPYVAGGPVYSSAVEQPKSYTLRVGALNQRYELGRPKRQIWVKRRMAWVPRMEGVEEIDGQP